MKQVMKPSTLLLRWVGGFAGVAILSGTLNALGIEYSAHLNAFYWAGLLTLAGVSILDGWRAGLLPSPRLQRHLPGSMTLDRWHAIQLDLQYDGTAATRARVFDHLPHGLESGQLPQSIMLPAKGTAQIGYRLRPLSRGNFTFEQCEIELHSPLRLWSTRRYLPLPDTTRVYPDFTRVYGGQLLAVENWLSQLGVRQLQRRGLGLEFNQLREFREGDSLRQIDWKATARQRAPIAREYQDERDQQIIFMLDCGRRMRSQDGDFSHFDHALNACLLLSYVALRQGDAVGLTTFAGEQNRYLSPVKGPSQLNRMLNTVFDLQTTQRPADYGAAVRQLLTRQKKRALIVLVTNVRDEDDEELMMSVKQLGRQHRVLVASLREEVLDRLRHSPVETYEQALVYCGSVNFVNARHSLHERLIAHGVNVLDARPGELGAQLVNRYMSWKKAGTL
ncbi:DUF58 domain-containing protein [Pseudomonas sp. CDFA 602]|uniref:DUF58 domain-containing protein n=1 Tax=Pseudomonas californiensis TaxID=2829823 RepID=UPI001E589779|nr:DUF58 domain-containing protein [Pseudomonas californiensis]MCD5995222.1 DUF58 domain-containing protein [Pseudomonas californiensis]MCD6000692.1 DUF58 domain-containing protein [Pseudomonas californiensis]